MDKKINGFIYVREEKGMYGLSQSGIITHTAVTEHLQLFVYDTTTITPGLWHHNKNEITFTLVVDDFGIKY